LIIIYAVKYESGYSGIFVNSEKAKIDVLNTAYYPLGRLNTIRSVQ